MLTSDDQLGPHAALLDTILSLPDELKSQLLAKMRAGTDWLDAGADVGTRLRSLDAQNRMQPGAPLARNTPEAIRQQTMAEYMSPEHTEAMWNSPAGQIATGFLGNIKAGKTASLLAAPEIQAAAAAKFAKSSRAADEMARGAPLTPEAAPNVAPAPAPAPIAAAADLPMTPVEDAVAAATAERRANPRAAKNTGKGAVGLIDWSSMTPLARQTAALADIHLKQMPDGKYVGSPDLDSSAQLGGMRRRLYSELRGMMEKSWVSDYLPWYERQRAGVVEAAGPDLTKQHALAQGIGVYSPQSNPATNFTSAVDQAAHYSTTGDPTLRPRTKPQMRNFANQITGAAEATQGPKTGPFAKSSDPTGFDPDMATNDIWVGRFLGYDNGKFSRGFTPQEHGFVQGELQRMTALANKEKWGGRGDWHVEELQAIPWIEYKAQSLVKKRGLSYADAIHEAMNTTLEALPRNTTMLNNEMIPGAASGHMPELINAPQETKLAYTNAPGNFLDPNQRNAFWQSLPMAFERPALPYTAAYKNSLGQQETGHGIAFRPLTNRLSPGGGSIAPESQYAINVQQGLHGLFNAQEGSVHSQFFPQGSGMRAGDVNAALLQRPAGGAPISAADLAHLEQAGAAYGMPNAVHYGEGNVMLTNFDPTAAKPTPKQRKQIQQAARAPIQLGRQQGDGVWLSDEWAQPQGSGAVTNRILKLLDENPQQSAYLLEQYDKNPEVMKQIAAMNPRDDSFAQTLQTSQRADLRKLREDVVSKFGSLKAFFEFVRKHGAAGYPAVGAMQLARPDQGQQQQ